MLGEIYLCRFPFTDGVGFKIRPALFLFELDQDAIICRVTGKARTGQMDVLIENWQEAGLLKPSIARVDRIITAEKTVFIRSLGHLVASDLDSVRKRWNDNMRL